MSGEDWVTLVQVMKCSPAQREMRDKMLISDIIWWEAHSANAAMAALAASGVKFQRGRLGKEASISGLGGAAPRPFRGTPTSRARRCAARGAASLAEREGTELPATKAYYSLPVGSWKVTPDYQFIVNRGYNRDRGPISILSLRLRTQF